MREDVNVSYMQRLQQQGTVPGARRHSLLRTKVQANLKSFKRRALKVIYWLPAQILRLTQLRFPGVTGQTRIGHLVADTDWYVRKMVLGDLPKTGPVLLLRRGHVANQAYVDMLRQHYMVIQNEILCALIKPFTTFDYLRIDMTQCVSQLAAAADYYDVMKRWGDRPSIWALPEDIDRRGRLALREMGLPEDAWFVCVHSREGGYAPKSEFMHAHRNSEIASYNLAIEAIVARGGYCIRVGDNTMDKMPDQPGAIDYAHSQWKSDWMDLFLGARCRFFLGNSSGLAIVSSIFGIPSVLANMIPLSTVYGIHPHDLSIPKLLANSDGRRLSFAEIFSSDIADYRFAGLMSEAGLTVIDNTPEQIKDATVELLDRLDGVESADLEPKLQDALRAQMRPHHYTYGSAAKIGGKFLSDHADLLK